MNGIRRSLMGAAALVVLAAAACNEQRRHECDSLLDAMKPLDKGTPSAEVVKSVDKQIEGLKLTDETLKIYAGNYRSKLGVLSGTLELKASSSPPDGVDEVIATNLKKARTDAADVARYCAP
jgi:hypothetical protein